MSVLMFFHNCHTVCLVHQQIGQTYLKRISNTCQTSTHRQLARHHKPSHHHQLGSKHNNLTAQPTTIQRILENKSVVLAAVRNASVNRDLPPGRLPQCRVRALGVRRRVAFTILLGQQGSVPWMCSGSLSNNVFNVYRSSPSLLVPRTPATHTSICVLSVTQHLPGTRSANRAEA